MRKIGIVGLALVMMVSLFSVFEGNKAFAEESSTVSNIEEPMVTDSDVIIDESAPDVVVDGIVEEPASETEVVAEETVIDTSLAEFTSEEEDPIAELINGGKTTEPTYADACSCGGGSYGSPIRIKSNTIDMWDIPLEYGFANGQFVIMRRPGVYYYKQNATTTYFNEITADITQKISTGFSSFILYKGIDKIPYMARLYNYLNQPAPYNWGDYTKLASAWQLEKRLPIWGRIMSAPVPSSGTKQVIVYISKTGKDYTWHRRVSFTISPDKSITIKKWWVN
jgi:hypothetical protein